MASSERIFGLLDAPITVPEPVAPAVLRRPVIRLVDANGNTVPSNGVTITAALASGSGTLGGTLTALTTNGVATFSSLALTGTAGSYTITFSSGGVTSVTSGAITLSAGAPVALAYSVQPSTVIAGAVITPAVQVRVVDGAGNTVLTAANPVTLAFGANPGGSALGGTLTVAAVAGVASFGNLTLDKAAAGYTLAASAAGLTGTTSNAFTVTPGAAAALVISAAPTSGQSGATLAPQPAVRIVDANGNTVTSSSATVTATLASGAGTLGGTLTAAAVSGVATFTNLAVTGSVGSYTLGFSSPLLTGVTSGAIALSAGPAAALVFQVQPTPTAAGSTISPALQVRVVDGAGNLVTTATNTVAVALGANPGPSTLGGTTSAAAVAGVATFGNLTLNRAAAGYTLVATAAGLVPDTTVAFSVIPGAATALAITTAPTTGQSGAILAPQPVIRLVDANGNTVPSNGVTITAALASGSGALSGTLTATTVSGVASFTNLSLTGTAGNYTIIFTSGALASVTTGTIALSAGAPAALDFQAQPTTSIAGTSITPPIRVRVLDGAGNVVTTATTPITLAIGNNPSGGTLGGTATVSASAGVAQFNGLSLNKSGTGYTLVATGGALPSATSTAFDIAPAAASAIAFSVQPSTVAAGAAIAPAVQVEVQDALGNRVTSSTASITVAIGNNPGGSVLGGTTTASAVAGVATFATLTLNKSGAGYTLGATSGGLGTATSGVFTVNPGSATALAITTAPTTAVNGVALAPQPVVRLVDANGNTVPTSGVTITAALATGSGTLGGPLTASTVNGVATFANLALTGTVGAYTINFSSGALTSVTSGAITLSAGAPAGLVFQVQPSTVASGAAITPAVQVRVVDASGNLVPMATNTVTMGLGGNPVGGVLGGTLSVAAAAGVATFSTLTLDKAGVGYSLAASSSGLSPATSNAFNVTAGAASKLAFFVQPTTAVAGAGISPAVQVEVQDAAGNRVTTATTSITITIGTNPGSSTLGGTSTVAAVAGVATFSGLSLNKTGAAYTLVANGGGLTAATSAGFDITPGAPAALVFLGQPTGAAVGATITPAVTVRIEDAQGNLTASTAVVALAFGNNPGSATLAGTTSIAAVGGVATFGNLTVNRTGVAYTLVASSTGLTPGTSTGFTIISATTSTSIISNTPNPSVVGQSVAVNYSVTSGGGTPTGNVTVSDGVDSCVGTVSAGTCSLALTTAGGRTLTATYATDGNFAGSASVGASHTVNQAATTTSILTDEPDPSNTVTPVAVTWSVAASAPGAGTPTGTVTVTTDGAETCSAAVAAGGCSLTFTTIGAHTITATYGGDTRFVGSVSTPVAHTVN